MSTLQASGYAQIPPEGGLVRNDTTRKFELGTVVSDTFGNSYRYVKANEAIAIGQIVTSVVKAAWDSTIVMDGASAAGDLYLHVDTLTSAMTVNQYRGYYVSQATASGLGRGYKIKSHGSAAATTGELDIWLEDAVQEVIGDGDVLYIYHPYLVELVDADTELIMGVATGTISSGSYGFVQIGGHCPAVAAGHSSSAAIVLNEPLVPIAGNPGSVQGMAGSAEADIMEAAASPLRALQAVNANTTGYVEAFIQGMV
jgi:hypothetical protein